MVRQRLNQVSRLLRSVLLGLAIVLLVCLIPIRPFAALALDSSIPTVPIAWEGQYAQVPDWAQITFRTLPPIQSSGSFNSSSDINHAVGYDLSRTWQAGQTAESYLKLGDFQTSLYPQIFNLYTIAQMTQLDLKQTALSALELAGWQTLDDLVTAIPGLGNYPVRAVPPIAALLAKQFPQNLGFDAAGTIAELLNANSTLGQLSLGQLGEQLRRFAITDIPGIESIPLQNLADWGNSTIGGIPGLADIPLAQMSNPITTVGAIGTVDVVYGTAERNRTHTISGSNQEGFEVPCQEECAHVELAGQPPLYGKQWISGKHQQVKGGFGILGALSDGKEPTGRHPFGEVFKVAVWDTEEATGSASTALFFRICHRGIPDLGCTPYFLGPVPFLSFHEKEPIFVGLLDTQGGASSPASIPAGVIDRARAMGIPEAALSGGGRFFSSSGSLCGAGISGVDFEALAAAFSSIEGNYGSVGTYVCDGDGNCGRGLGRYQYMSYRLDVRSAISQKEGGVAFLARIDAGVAVSEAEAERFFSKTDQDGLFKADQTRNINQAISEGFEGSRLIERVGQIHFGGAGAPIDGEASDVHRRLTLKTYGDELRSQYETALKSDGKPSHCQTSAKAGKVNQAIAQSMEQMGSFNTLAGPDGGGNACAWAVNQVLTQAGIEPLGDNPNYVPAVEAALQSGRGTQITDLSQARAGDIVIEGGQWHMGICLDQGCTRVRSNSSSRATFVWESNANFDNYFMNKGYDSSSSSRIYRLNN